MSVAVGLRLGLDIHLNSFHRSSSCMFANSGQRGREIRQDEFGARGAAEPPVVGDEIRRRTMVDAASMNTTVVERPDDDSCKTPVTMVHDSQGVWSETDGDLLEEVDWEEELSGLSKEALIATVRSILSGVVEALPAEVEAARSATRDEVSAAFGKELLRLEEQYE